MDGKINIFICRQPLPYVDMQNRQKDEMVRDILTSANGGATITQIMFKAYLSHAQAKQYLGILIENGHIEFDVIERKYRTTDSGLHYLSAIQNLSDILQLKTRRATSPLELAASF